MRFKVSSGYKMRIISLLKNKLNIKKSNRLTCVEIGKHTYGYPTVYNWRKNINFSSANSVPYQQV
jgi:hypothetical protein